jgi:hypothetical protein
MEYGYSEVTEAQLRRIRIENRNEIDLTPSTSSPKRKLYRLIQASGTHGTAALIALTYESGADK